MLYSSENRGLMRLQVLYGILGVIVGALAGILVVGIPDVLKLFVIVVGLFAFAASIARVEWGLLVLVFITYTRFSDVAIQYHGAPSVAKSFILLLIIAIFIRWIVYSEKPEGWQQSAFMMMAYGVVTFVSIIYAASPERAQEAWMDLVKNGIIVVVITILLHRATRFRQVMWSLLFAGMFMGTLSVIQYLTGTFGNEYAGFAQAPIKHLVGGVSSHRVAGPIGDPNFYAQAMLVLIPIALDRFWNEENRKLRWLAAWATVVCSLAVVFTFSRGGFLAMVVVFGAMFIFRPPKPSALIITLLIALILFPFVPSEYTARIMTIVDFLPSSEISSAPIGEASYRGRLSEVLVGLMMFRDNPILGVGFNNYPVHYQEYSRRLGLDPRLEQRSAHNLYVEVAAETGILGLVTFGVILFITLNGIYRSWQLFRSNGMRKNADMVAAFGIGFIGYLSAAMFVHDAYPRYFWLLLGIGLAIQNVAKNETESFWSPKP